MCCCCCCRWFYVDLEQTLPNTFDILDQSLSQIQETASELREQGATYSNLQINEIIVSANENSDFFFFHKRKFDTHLIYIPGGA